MTTLTALRAGTLAGARQLRLSERLTDFPREIFDLADTLEVLDLNGNALSDLPDDFDRLHRLRIAFLSFNAFKHVPDVLGRCRNLTMLGMKGNAIEHVDGAALAPTLRWLILTDNKIPVLPDQIGNCRDMQKLMLAGNRLTRLPDSLAHCENIELLRLSANRLQSLPDWLFTLPHLAWLALAGNPVTDAARSPPTHRRADWRDIELREPLGEGASGVIRRARWAAHPEDVAVKLYKGAVTSDGLPDSEIQACMTAGNHPHLIAALARIQGHPTGLDGLVMPLVDPGLRNLAAPPSFESCTRDVYAPELMLSIQVVTHLAACVARAASHLHAAGLMHGDLYGHNILYADDGDALLGDFGAASFYMGVTPTQACERLEVRAFGILLQELLALVRDVQGRQIGPGSKPAAATTLVGTPQCHEECGSLQKNDDTPQTGLNTRQTGHDSPQTELDTLQTRYDRLQTLAEQCTTLDVNARPRFSSIVRALEAELARGAAGAPPGQ